MVSKTSLVGLLLTLPGETDCRWVKKHNEFVI
jgi:hypothetical protein